MEPRPPKKYVGIDKDVNGGMTQAGKIVRDAWVFGLLEEGETCEGWSATQVERLWVEVNAEWEKYGWQVNGLPDELRARFMRIQKAAVVTAREAGWNPDLDIADS